MKKVLFVVVALAMVLSSFASVLVAPMQSSQRVEAADSTPTPNLMLGSGTASDPFIIQNVTDLQNINNNLSAYYELGNDIDASATSGWNGGQGFIQIGAGSNYFTGQLDGKGHKVTSLFMNYTGNGYFGAAIFHIIGVGGIVKHIGFESINITSGQETYYRAATFCSKNYGYVENVYITGTLNVTGTSSTVSGFCDTNYGSILNSYSGCILIGIAKNGFNIWNYGTITSCYWDTQTSGCATSDGGTGKTTTEMKQQATFVGWDFTTPVWQIVEGVTYPTLTGMPTPIPTSWSFAIITDLHVGEDAPNGDFGAAGWNDNGDYSNSISTKGLQDLITSVTEINNSIQFNGNQNNIKFVVVLGDFTDSAELSEMQAAIDVLNTLSVPWLPIIGNHDIWPYTDSTELPRATSGGDGSDKYFNDWFSSAYQNFSDKLGLPSTWKEPTHVLNQKTDPNFYSYFQNLAFDYGGFHFIGLDFNERSHAPWPNKGVMGHAALWDFSGGTLSWFEQHLTDYLNNPANQGQGKNIIILSHQPFACPYNFPGLQATVNLFYGFSNQDTNYIADFLNGYKDNISIQFSGHWHPGDTFTLPGGFKTTPSTRQAISKELVYTYWFTKTNVMPCVTIPGNLVIPWVQVVGLNPSDKSVNYYEDLFPAITYRADCPVDLKVTDPDNLVISKDINQIPGAMYITNEYDENGNSSPCNEVWIPNRKLGNYSIQVIPQTNANASDTFTLTASPTEYKWGDTPIVLAQNVTISNTPAEPYTFEVKQRTTTNLSYTGALSGYNFDTINLTAVLSTDNGSLLSGKTINFVIENKSVSAVTDSNGVATASLTLSQTPSQYYYVEYGFDGDKDYLPYYDSQPFEIINIPPAADIGGPYTGNEGSPITFNGSGSYDPDSTIVDYSWDFGDGSPAVNGTATPTHIYTSAGTYTVTLNVTDDSGVVGTDTATVEIAANIYTLTTSSTDGGNVTTPGEGNNNYNCSQLVSLVATPDSCYHFVNWTGDTINIADVNASSTTIVMNGSYSITANFAINTYTLTYNAETGGSINGTTPQTVNCGANGSAVTAVPNTCYHFVNWSDGVTTTSRTDTNVAANTTVTANFAITAYKLNTSATNGSVITPGQPGPFTYNCSQVVSIQATPANANCKFVNWTGNTGTIANVSANSTTIIMNGNYSIQANFVVSGPTTTTYTFATGGGVNKWCWEGHVHLIDWNNGHPSSPSDFANSYGYAAGGSSAYSAVSSSDSSSWRSNISHDLGCCAFDRNCEFFKFKINESPASITNIQIKWKGHGTTGETIYHTTEKLWKASNNTWNTLNDQTNITSDTIWTNNVSSSCSTYIDSTGNLSILVAAQRSGLPNNCGIWTNYIEVTITHN